MTVDERVAELLRQNAVLRNQNAQLSAELAQVQEKLDLLRLGLTQGLAPEVEQFNAVFTNMLRLL